MFEDTAPVVEGLSIDEAFLDVRGLDHISGTPVEIAAACAGGSAREVGLPITVGVARTKFLAKVASAVAKPDGLLLVAPERELDFLHPLPVERLWGVGRVTAEKLHQRGITTVGAGRAAGRARRSSRCSAARPGRHLHALAHNYDPRPVEVRRRRRSIGAQRALGRRRRSPEELAAVADRARRPGGAPAAHRPPGLPDGGAADALRGLLARDAVLHAARGRPTRPTRSCRPRAACCRASLPIIERRGSR